MHSKTEIVGAALSPETPDGGVRVHRPPSRPPPTRRPGPTQSQVTPIHPQNTRSRSLGGSKGSDGPTAHCQRLHTDPVALRPFQRTRPRRVSLPPRGSQHSLPGQMHPGQKLLLRFSPAGESTSLQASGVSLALPCVTPRSAVFTESPNIRISESIFRSNQTARRPGRAGNGIAAASDTGSERRALSAWRPLIRLAYNLRISELLDRSFRRIAEAVVMAA